MWRPSRKESGLNLGADLLHYGAGGVLPGTFLLKKKTKKKTKSDLFSQERNLKLLTRPPSRWASLSALLQSRPERRN